MFIITGHRDREVQYQVGQFHCPKCQQVRMYAHKKVERYFTFFFVELFNIGTRSEYNECQVCLGKFKNEELMGGAPLGAGISIPHSSVQSYGATPYINANANTNKNQFPYLGCLNIGCGTILLGTALVLIAGMIGTLLDKTKPPKDLGTQIGAFFLCPCPLLLIGMLMAGFGIRAFMKKKEKPSSV